MSGGIWDEDAYAAFGVIWAFVFAGGACWLARNSRDRAAAAWITFGHVCAVIAYTAPLPRPYSMSGATDRMFNLGMAASVAAGNSAFEHTQAGLGAPEPFWNAALGLVARAPELVPTVFAALTFLSLAGLAGGLWFGLTRSGSSRWLACVVIAATLGLSSHSATGHAPLAPTWQAYILVKPNHLAAFAVLFAMLPSLTRSPVAWLRVGLGLGLLAWMFLVGWAYVVAGLLVWIALDREQRSKAGRIAAAMALSALVCAPLVFHLARDYSPGGRHQQAAGHMWSDPLGELLARPEWTTVDLGFLVPLGALGATWGWRSGRPALRLLASLTLTGAAGWVVSVGTTYGLGINPEPDELHHYLRLLLALSSGVGLAGFLEEKGPSSAAARELRGLLIGGVVWCSLPASWNPAADDRYRPWLLEPVPQKVLEYGQWVRGNTPHDAVFLAGDGIDAAVWIPALSGRRVLLAPSKLRPANEKERQAAASTILGSSEPERVRRAARSVGVTHVAVDDTMLRQRGPQLLGALRAHDAFRLRYQSTALHVFEVVPAGTRTGRRRAGLPDGSGN